jgi:DNA-binding FadR family transcriptional regulator
MEFRKLSVPTLKDMFVRELENMILSGKLEIGAQLPPERELAESMQVSRAVVNAGINEMASKGFLEIRPRIGTFVSDYRRKGTAETLLSIMKYNGGMLRRPEIRSILEIRIVLDLLAVRLTIPKITEEEINLLQSYVDLLAETTSAETAAHAAFGFHHELGIISGNTLLPLIFYSFKEPIFSLWQRFCRLYGVSALHDNTSRLLGYISRKDLDGAVNWIEKSVGESINGSRQIYSE